MPGRARPIEKFAEATAKCSPEVCHSLTSIITIIVKMNSGRCLRQVHRGKLSKRTQGYVC